MTKSQLTMYRLASLRAAGNGPRIAKGRAGVFLTVGELKALYGEEGFNVSPGRKVLENHICSWMWADKAVLDGAYEENSSVVWFPCPPFMTTEVRILSEKCGGRSIESIDRTWPQIAQLHAIQEALPEGEQ